MNDLLLMLLADARLPVGGHVSSSGLEPALLGGLCEADVLSFISTRLRTATLVDAATAVVAARTLDLGSVGDAWAARTPSLVAREAALTLGRGVRRLVVRLWPGEPATAALSQAAVPWRPVAVGAMAAAAGLDAWETALLICHDDVATMASAALKLTPRDPAETTAWVLSAHPLMARIADRASRIADPDEIPAPSAPLAECWTQWHADHERRLFLV